MKVLIIGCGSIGTTLAGVLSEAESIDEIFITDSSAECAARLANKVPKVSFAESPMDVLDKVGLVIEAAAQSAVKEHILPALEKGKDVVVLSVGAFVDDELREKCERYAKEKGAKIYIPSGAVAGLDGIRAACVGNIHEMQLTTTKSPEGLQDVEYLKEKGINLAELEEPTVLFDGIARDAVKYFPKNVNVAATISLAGFGFDKTRVKIIADPKCKENRHQIYVKGDFGELRAETKNVPFSKNPKTSYLAAIAAIATVKKIVEGIYDGN